MANPWTLERARIPNVPLKTLQRLSKTLIRDKPVPATPYIDESCERLEAQVAETDIALAKRFRETNPTFVASEVEFDRAADAAWIWLRRLLEGWRDVYGHPGFDALPFDLQQQLDLPKLRARADQARILHDRLFGVTGTNWTTTSFIEQSETMATILRVIKADDLGDELTEVVGDELPELLETLQVHYEDMVSARMRRDRGPADNLRVLRERLRFRLDHYKNAVESLRDPDQPSTQDIVAQALRALTMLNQRLLSGASAAEIEEFADAELVDLEFEQDQDQAQDQLTTEQPAEAPATELSIS